MSRFLYLDLVEPFSAALAGETITLDKWLATLSQPQPRRLPMPPAGTVDVLAPESVTLDKWYSESPLPGRRQPSRPLVGMVDVLTPEPITLDKWYVPPPAWVARDVPAAWWLWADPGIEPHVVPPVIAVPGYRYALRGCADDRYGVRGASHSRLTCRGADQVRRTLAGD